MKVQFRDEFKKFTEQKITKDGGIGWTRVGSMREFQIGYRFSAADRKYIFNRGLKQVADEIERSIVDEHGQRRVRSLPIPGAPEVHKPYELMNLGELALIRAKARKYKFAYAGVEHDYDTYIRDIEAEITAGNLPITATLSDLRELLGA